MIWLDSITNSREINFDKLRATARDKEAWCAADHGVTKSQTWLSDWTMTTTGNSGTMFQIQLLSNLAHWWNTNALVLRMQSPISNTSITRGSIRNANSWLYPRPMNQEFEVGGEKDSYMCFKKPCAWTWCVLESENYWSNTKVYTLFSIWFVTLSSFTERIPVFK